MAILVRSVASALKVGKMDPIGIFTSVYPKEKIIYVIYAHASFPPVEKSGVVNTSTIPTASTGAPASIQGRFRPILVLVRSTSAPTI